MTCNNFPILLLIAIVGSTEANRFFISGPSVFHVGVKEKVFVQMGGAHLNKDVTLHLEHETKEKAVSEKKTVRCTTEGEIQTVELMIVRELMSGLPPPKHEYYLLLVAVTSSGEKKKTNVLVSNHRGYIFIQTDQPIYNPSQTVNYRIFTLDHTSRPHEEIVHISVVNAAGSTIMKNLKTAKGGILKGTFVIPDVSKMGTWRITARYDEKDTDVTFREFKVKRFVLPSFDVKITMDQRYILMNAEQLNFNILAMYSHGEKVQGAYHCLFGVVEHGQSPDKRTLINGLQLTGSVRDGTATASLPTANLTMLLNNTLSDLQQNGAKLYLGVFVTNIQSGEIQETEVSLPIISHRYTMDLSRTRSYFLPGYPVDVVVFMRHPDGSPAAGVPVMIGVPRFTKESRQYRTNQEGAVVHEINTYDAAEITVEVSTDGLQQSKTITKASSPSGSYLYISFTKEVYSVNDFLSLRYNTVNGPNHGFIYYMVLSRGILIKKGAFRFGDSVKHSLQITHDMVPSFRLIGYYYNQQGVIIADSVWVDVKDECEIKVKVERKGPFQPGRQSVLDFDLHGQKAKVALLAVDKAFYALNVDNKLTAKQVFSSMQSYDLGCSYGGGSDPASVLIDAGLSFVSHSEEKSRGSSHCASQSARQRRSVDIQQEMMALKSNFSSEKLEDCCVRGFSLIPMRRTCQERARRVSLMEADPRCEEAFLTCCLKGENLRQKKIQADAEKGFGRTASLAEIEEFFYDTSNQYIRRFFPESFAFTEFEVNDKGSYTLHLPDSITTWEIQVITVSAASGFCVVEPSEVRAFKTAFVSLTLPHSVKKYEQISISPVIYNYGGNKLQVAVHMEQTEGLCSPGSATTTAFVNITVEPNTSQFVSFSVVPMVTGPIPIKIRLYDIENEDGIDAIEKILNVWTEGIEHREEKTHVLNLDGRSTESFPIDRTPPDNAVPDSSSNVFFSLEGDGFGNSHARNLLTPEKVARLIQLPTGCSEQTMSRLAPTALALRYLDKSDQWFGLSNARNVALDYVERGMMRILTFKQSIGAYPPWASDQGSTWLTAFVVKVLSLIAERKKAAVNLEEIRHPVRYLLSAQNTDGSFHDKHPVIHRGILKGKEQRASVTAYIALALHRSLEFQEDGKKNSVEASISRSTTYLQSNLEELQHPYAIAITAYCLSVCLPKGADVSAAWSKLQSKAFEGAGGCYMWTADAAQRNREYADAMTVETTAYALLTAVAQNKIEMADKIACWLTTQENYFGSYRSTQDTIMALESLSEYELSRPPTPEINAKAEFTVQGRGEIVKLALENKRERVETDLKKLTGNNIKVQLTGNGDVKVKIVKAFHLLEPKDTCKRLSIRVDVVGKVKYTAKVIENYDYYEDFDVNEAKESRVPRSAMEWFDARARNRRDVDNSPNSETVTYHVCVGHSLDNNLTGMAIADITLLSGFEAEVEDLERLKSPLEQYISHYEVSSGRVLLYFNKLHNEEECISFDAIQRMPIGLLQPAPAVFYDYYEPDRRCTVFYSAPKRSRMVSTLCSEDVCQCAERPCHKVQKTFSVVKGQRITKTVRVQHACFFPRVDYAYVVEVLNVSLKSNFELYKTNVLEVLKLHGDMGVRSNSLRVFAKRRHCKGQLELGEQYLLMGKDGSTTDSDGFMQYLLESNTWVEKKPSEDESQKSANRAAYRGFNDFLSEYRLDGCRQ